MAISNHKLQGARGMAPVSEITMQRHEYRQAAYAINKHNRIGLAALLTLIFACLVMGAIS